MGPPSLVQGFDSFVRWPYYRVVEQSGQLTWFIPKRSQVRILPTLPNPSRTLLKQSLRAFASMA